MTHNSPKAGLQLAAMYLLALAAATAESLPSVGADLQVASWYGKNYRGRPTASGERFDPADHTAAHPSLPFGTLVEVTSARTGRAVVVRVNDRGPYDGGDLDLSEAAARSIGLVAEGRGEVLAEVIGRVE